MTPPVVFATKTLAEQEAERLGVLCERWYARVEALQRVIREVRDEMLADGYHRPNAWILKLDRALGEEQE